MLRSRSDVDLDEFIGYLSQNIQNSGAGDGVRTRDPELGKLVLYQLSYTRNSSTLALPAAAGKNNLFQGKIRPVDNRISTPPKLLRFGGFASI